MNFKKCLLLVIICVILVSGINLVQASDAILWDTMVSESDRSYGDTRFISSNAYANQANWVQVPYGTTSWGFTGSALLENGDITIFLHDMSIYESPFFYGMIDGGYQNGGYSQAGELYGSYGSAWDSVLDGYTIITNTPDEIKIRHDAHHRDPVTYPGQVRTYFTLTSDSSWFERQGVDSGQNYAFSVHARAAEGCGFAPPNYGSSGYDFVVDSNDDYNNYNHVNNPYITHIPPSTHNQMIMQQLGTWDHGQPYIMVPSNPTDARLRLKTDTHPSKHGDGYFEALTATEVSSSSSVFIGQINHKDTIKNIFPDVYISKGQTYRTNFKEPVPGIWRLSIRINDNYYTYNIQNSDFSFVSPQEGKLEFVGWYLFDRTSNTPSNVYTPMDMYRAAHNEAPIIPSPPPTPPAESFTIIVLPDTQFYSHWSPDLFTSQTQWIVDNKDKLNIVFVTHVGDIVYDFNVEQDWNNARAAMDLLDDASIQYGVLPGNHDGAMQWHWGDTKNYNTYFSLNRFKNKPGWGGHFDSTSIDPPAEYSGDMDATYQLFSAGGDDYIIVHLQYCPFQQHRDWASDILKKYPNRKAIISTHGYLDRDGTLLDNHPAGHKIQEGSGEDIWNDVVLPNPNVFMVLCGHIGGAEELNVSKGIAGQNIYQMLADYTSSGPGNYLRIMTFEPDEDKIYVKTYSPNLDKYQTDANSQFELYFDMSNTGSNPDIPIPPIIEIPLEFSLYTFYEYLSNPEQFDSIDDIKYDEGNFTPSMEWNQMGKIRCWVDIVGYTGMVRAGDQYYVGQPPVDCVRVQHGKEHLVNTGVGTGWSVTSFKSYVREISMTDLGIVASVEVILKYKHTTYKLRGYPPRLVKIVKRYTQTAHFNDIESFVPVVYPDPGEYDIDVYVYNNTIKPKAVCEFNISGLDIGVVYTYNNETLKFKKYNFELNYTEDKNCPYGDMTLINQWEYITENNTQIFPLLNSVWMPGDNFGKENFSCYVYTPYNHGDAIVAVTQIDGFNGDINILNILSLIVYVVTILLVILLAIGMVSQRL